MRKANGLKNKPVKEVKSVSQFQKNKGRFYKSLIIPSIIILTIITILPVLYLLATSLTSWDLSRPGSLQFIGLRNYIRLLSGGDRRFVNSVVVQLKLSLYTVPAQILLGLGLAVFVKEKFTPGWLTELARGVFLIPMVIPPIVAGLIWKILFTPQVSIINYIVTSLGGQRMEWLGHPDLALVAIAIGSIWMFFPFCFLLLYAGLLSLPEEPYEAAQVDGASFMQTFRYITLPMLGPTLTIVTLFRIIDSIKSFPLVYVITGGGPGTATEPTNFYAYIRAFTYSYAGYSSAMIIVIISFTMLITAILIRRIKWSRG